MDEQTGDRGPDDTVQSMETELMAWRKAHPKATFAELERAVEERIREVRVQFLAKLSGVADIERPRCPDCGTRMAPRGQQTRQVTIPGDQRVVLERAYLVCPACGAGLFPPG